MHSGQVVEYIRIQMKPNNLSRITVDAPIEEAEEISKVGLYNKVEKNALKYIRTRYI